MTPASHHDVQPKLRIGDLLVAEGLISDAQLREALAEQKARKNYLPLGEVCIDLCYISQMDLRKVLRKFRKRIFLGELLVNLNLISQTHLDEVLETQRRQGGKLGKLLIKVGHVSEVTLINALSVQLGIPKIEPSLDLIDKSLMRNLKQEFLTRHEFLPVYKDSNVLTVVMSDPLNEETIRDLERYFDCEIDAAIATSNEILNTIHNFFTKSQPKPKGLVIGDMDLSKRTNDSVVEVVNYIISNAITEGASDIHIEPQERTLRVRYRIDGILLHKTDLPISLAPALISRIKVLCGLDITEKRRHQDGRIEAKVLDREVDLRVSSYAAHWGENVVMRILHRQSTLIGLERLGFSPLVMHRYRKILDYPSGIMLVTGPTGSGKTTTLYSSLHYLNQLDKKIITVEDPVEYTIEGIIQGSLDRQIGQDYMDFIKSMMRQDPDVIMVGEIRDQSGAEATIQAALTGHKVFSTFHTDDTTGALLRLMDMGIDTFLISSTVVSILAQRLVRVLCPHCKQPTIPDRELLTAFNVVKFDPSRHHFFQAKGCIQCNHTGYKGRVGLHELLVVNDAVRNSILERNTSTLIRLIARKKGGLVSMREDGFYKALKGVTTLEEILRVVFYNESDSIEPRTVDEVIDLCEGRLEGTEFNLGIPDTPVSPRPAGSVVGSGVVEGEVFRITMAGKEPEGGREKIDGLFRAYQNLRGKLRQSVNPGMSREFYEFIGENWRRMQRGHGMEQMDFVLLALQGRAVLRVEGKAMVSLIPVRPPQFSSLGG